MVGQRPRGTVHPRISGEGVLEAGVTYEGRDGGHGAADSCSLSLRVFTTASTTATDASRARSTGSDEVGYGDDGTDARGLSQPAALRPARRGEITGKFQVHAGTGDICGYIFISSRRRHCPRSCPAKRAEQLEYI